MVRQRALLFSYRSKKLSVETRVASQGFFQEACLKLKGSVRKNSVSLGINGENNGYPRKCFSMNRKRTFFCPVSS